MSEQEIVVKEDQHPKLCFVLGFFLSLLGVLLATIIGKGDGCKRAFKGIAFRWGLLVILWIVVSGYHELTGVYNELTGKEAIEKVKARNSKRETMPVKTREYKKKQQWRISTKKSPLDDSENIMASIDANEKYKNLEPSLVLMRKEGKTSAFISFYSHVGRYEMDVIARFDQDEAIKEKWNPSTSGESLYMPWEMRDIVETIIESKKLVVQIEPKYESTMIFTFDIGGLTNKLSNAAEIFR